MTTETVTNVKAGGVNRPNFPNPRCLCTEQLCILTLLQDSKWKVIQRTAMISKMLVPFVAIVPRIQFFLSASVFPTVIFFMFVLLFGVLNLLYLPFEVLFVWSAFDLTPRLSYTLYLILHYASLSSLLESLPLFTAWVIGRMSVTFEL